MKKKQSRQVPEIEQERVDIWMRGFVELLIQQVESMTPEQRKELDRKIADGKKTIIQQSAKIRKPRK
jgi:hypothetical protein